MLYTNDSKYCEVDIIIILQIKKLLLLKSQEHSGKKKRVMKEDLLYKRQKHIKLN